MTEERFNKDEAFQLYPIGVIKRSQAKIWLEIREPFRTGLKQLEHFSHIMVFWWADKHDNDNSRSIMVTEPPYAKGKPTGVFATRSEYRPNPIAMTTCKLFDVDEEMGVVSIANIDAFDESPVVDLKAYFPVCDRVQEAHIPEWLSDWPEWMPEGGLGL